MLDLAQFKNCELIGGFVISGVELTMVAMVDALDREAVAQTRIVGQRFAITLNAEMSEEELSVSIYHEILEAATVASFHPPINIIEFNEGDFEQAAKSAHAAFGVVSPDNLNRMLQIYGFS